MSISEDVKYVTLYRSLPVWAHGYILPFVLFYISLLIGWLYMFEGFAHLEAFFICTAAIGVLNIITCLACVWSIEFRCWMTNSKVSSIEKAKLVKVVPTPNNGSTELVKLNSDKDESDGHQVLWFLFQEVKYIYNRDTKAFSPIVFPLEYSAAHYTDWKGISDEVQLKNAERRYGLNKLSVVLPEFWDLFKERATAPFFIFQVFCVGLWCLDEYWYYSVFTLIMLIMFEALLVKQQQRNLSEIKKMSSSPHTVNVYRNGRWSRLSTEKLVPGDIVSICRNRSGYLVPCDILLIRGSCVVDEAMLTGESVPQMKEPLESSILHDGVFNIERDGKLHVVFGGTKIVQNSSPSSKTGSIKPPDNGCVGYVLRTGFNTSQGKLLRTILYGVKRVTANNLETFLFILFLLVFAIAASVYLWVKGTEDPSRNRYKLFLECTLILTSVVPPELPIELSLAVNTSLISLVKMGIYCTEPFRIPFGGKVDVCCFDKTGTLTSDDLVVEGIGGLSPDSDNGKPVLIQPLTSPPQSQYVLASCHSLVNIDGELTGDPLEKAALLSIDWRLSKNDNVTPSRGPKTSLHILNRFHFSSQLKRMSTVSQLTSSSFSHHIAAVKGAPEVIQDMLSNVPDNYREVYLKLARRGARVLALGYRNLGSLSMREVTHLKREDVEKDLEFAGFIAFSCPLKKQSKESVKMLKDSSHYVVMITGDNPLTACHVAKELRIATKKLLVLEPSNNGSATSWRWESISGGTVHAFEPDRSSIRQLGSTFDLAVTGEGLLFLSSVDIRILFSVLPFIKVFARVSPQQKELIINSYKSLGYHTLMCGDGTNDVGALKHAHVGVSLLSTVRMNKKPTDEKPSSSEQQLTRKPISSIRQQKKATSTASTTTNATRNQAQRNKLINDIIKQSEESLQDPSLVRLGDASIASPFTSRETSIKCICQVIRQGRCTLVTTLQMFKILALNALVLAYSQSVLYLDGIKFSDIQATIQGMLLAGCFLFISRSKPLETLSKERPLPNIFNVYTILTVMGQFVVHFSSLIYLVHEAKLISSPVEGFVDLEKEFEQNTLNSAVFLISITMQVSNFAVNYKGHPFMMGLRENKPLSVCLMVTGSIVLVLASGLFPGLCEYLEIVQFPYEFQTKLLMVLFGDFLCSLAVDTVLSFCLGTAKLKKA